jgi:hypothetical protein
MAGSLKDTSAPRSGGLVRWVGDHRGVLGGGVASLVAMAVVFLARSGPHLSGAAALAAPAGTADPSASAIPAAPGSSPYAIPPELMKDLPGARLATAAPVTPDPPLEPREGRAGAAPRVTHKPAGFSRSLLSERVARGKANQASRRAKLARAAELASPSSAASVEASRTAEPARAATVRAPDIKNRVPLVDDRRRVNILQ